MVREGYKQTEVGVIPEDWDYDSIQDKVTLGSGRHILSTNYNDEGIGKPYLTGPADFEQGKSEVSKWTTENGVEADFGDILITVKGSGAGSSFRLDLERAVISRQLMALRGKDVLCQDYLFYVFARQERNLASKAIGNLIPGLSRKDILELKILLPPPPEQQLIAHALSDVDALIAALEKAIGKKRAIKTATMQQLLTGKKRLPGFGEGKGDRQTEIGVIPKDWNCVEAGTVISFLGGYGFSSRFESSAGIRWLKIANVGIEKIKWDDVSYLPTQFQIEFRNYLLKPNDVVMALTRPILDNRLKVARLTKEDSPALLNQRVAKLIPKGNTEAAYLYYVVQRLNFVVAMNIAMAGSDPPNIGNAALEKILIAVPQSQEEQQTIATVLSDMDAEIAALEARLAKTQFIKQGMMQELLTGRTRLV